MGIMMRVSYFENGVSVVFNIIEIRRLRIRIIFITWSFGNNLSDIFSPGKSFVGR